MLKVIVIAVISFIFSYMGTFVFLGPLLEEFKGVDSYLPLVCIEIFFWFYIVFYTLFGVWRVLKKYIHYIQIAESPVILLEQIQRISYKGKAFIYDIVINNISQNVNNTGKQAREFLNDEEILSVFTHISILKNAPAILTSFGLMCTFGAILLGLKDVKPNDAGLMQGIEPLVASLSAKFLTSLVALSGAILLNFYTSWYFSKVYGYLEIIKNKIDKMFPMESLGKIISKNLTSDLDFQELQDDLASARRETINTIKEQLLAFQKLVSDNAIKQQLEMGNNIIEALSQQITQLQKNTQEAAQFLGSLTQASSQLSQFGSQMSQLTHISEILNNIQTSLHQDQLQMTDNYNRIMSELPKMAEEFGDVCVKMRNHLQNNYADAIETAISKGLEDPLMRITDKLEQVCQRLRKSASLDPVNLVVAPPTSSVEGQHIAVKNPIEVEKTAAQYHTNTQPQESPLSPVSSSLSTLEKNSSGVSLPDKQEDLSSLPVEHSVVAGEVLSETQVKVKDMPSVAEVAEESRQIDFMEELVPQKENDTERTGKSKRSWWPF